jgi:uncharacterized protein (TIGR02996 family)
MSHAAFLSTIRDEPAENTARLVYADWLEEQGGQADRLRAEFIRVQVRLSELDETDPARPALEDRENELLRQYESTWLGSSPGKLENWKFERGFLSEVTGSLDALASGKVAELCEHHAVGRVRVTSPLLRSEQLNRFASSQWLSGVCELFLSDALRPDDGLADLLGVSGLLKLTKLDLVRMIRNAPGPVPRLAKVLGEAPGFASVERLRLSGWYGPNLDLLAALARSHVEDLTLEHCQFHRGGLQLAELAGRIERLSLVGATLEQLADFRTPTVRPVLAHLGLGRLPDDHGELAGLLDLPGFANLVSLDLDETRLRSESVRGLLRTGFWRRCREFRLTRGQCPPALMAELAVEPGPEGLRLLRIGETGLRDEGVRHLLSAPWAAPLVELDLMRNFLTDDTCRAIRDEGPFRNLLRLDLRTNGPKLANGTKERITNAGIAALATAPCLSRLRSLNIHSLPITAAAADAVINSPNWKLAELDLGGTDIGPDGIRVLAESPNLSRLTRLNLSFIADLKQDDLLPLAESPYLSPICEVSGLYSPLSKRVREAFQERLGRRFRV